MLTATVVAVVLVAGPATAQTPTFSDVPVGHPFYTEITWAAAAGVTTGYGDGTFRPSAVVTRQAAVAFTHRLWLAAGNVDPDPLPDPGFSDLAAGDPFYDDIAWAADAGITTGYSDGTFRPSATVTRQAAVAFTHRLWLSLGNVDPDPLPDPGFSDLAAGHPFYTDIAWAADAGITTGYPDGTFRPSAVVTRQADMAFLYRLAATIGLPFDLTVDTATDAIDTNPGDGICDIGDGTCSLRAAIDETNAWPADDTITIASGVNPTLTISGSGEDNNATGDLDIRDDLTIDGDGDGDGDGATIDADGLDRVIDHHAGQLTVDDLTITGGNTTGYGGGIYSRSGSVTALSGTTIAANAARYGGGIYNSGTATITNVTVENNTALQNGGGIDNSGTVTITNSTIAANTTGSGGGIYNSGTATITNSTIAANASSYGGGIYNSGTVTITNSTIAANTAESGGGGIYDRGTATLLSSAVAANIGGDCSQAVLTGGYNLDSDGTCGFGDPTDLASQNALLGPLVDNGGPTATRLPYADSPLVDAIPSGANGCGTTVAVDQRGMARPDGVGCDIGAVEGTGPTSPPPASLTVDTATDAVDTTPGDGNCDIGDGTCSLRAAIQETNAWPAADTITIASGVNPTLTITGTGEGLSATGDLDIRDNLTIDGNGATIDAGGLDRVIEQHLGRLDLNALTITGGETNFGSGGGAGIRTGEGTVTYITDSSITDNTANDSQGGGIHTFAGAVTITRTTIARNSTLARPNKFEGGAGGGIRATLATFTVIDSTITDNTATHTGGGISSNASTTTLTNTTVAGNAAKAGGGIINLFGSLSVEMTTIANNTAANAATLLDRSGGGGIYNDGGSVSIQDTTITGNTAVASSGGGIYNEGGTVAATNSTIEGNAADQSGGGIYGAFHIDGPVTIITNSTITNNTANDSGGGIYQATGLSMSSSVVALNPGGDCSGSVVTGGYNLDGDGSCGFVDVLDLASGDPLLGPLADNGGPTLTRLPLLGSPLVDAIAAGANGCGTTVVVDQRGVARPAGAGCDVGAVEGVGPPAP